MATKFEELYRALCVALVAECVAPGAAWALGPSDCVVGHADSTCGGKVASAPSPPAGPPVVPNSGVIYNGPIAQLPSGINAYWGFDFVSDAAGVPSPMPQDMYINRSNSAFDIQFLFTIPGLPCGHGCMPRLEFRTDVGWNLTLAPFEVTGSTATSTLHVAAGQSYGWMMGVEQTRNPQIVVTVPPESKLNMSQIGLDPRPDIANPISPPVTVCACSDGTIRACWPGTRYSSGLMGPYDDYWSVLRPDAWSDCPPRDGS